MKASQRDVRLTFLLLYNMARAHIFIRTLCSEKAFTRSPVVHFTLISISFACEGLRREAFTPPFPAVNTSLPYPSHLRQLKINEKRAFCERVNTFSGKKIPYIRKQDGGGGGKNFAFLLSRGSGRRNARCAKKFISW